MTIVNSVSDAGLEHQITPLELFFDLVFVFAITQVTSLLADQPTWGGVLRGMLVLAAVWWAWTGYAWLTSAIDVYEGGVRLAMLASMGAMLGVALAEPRAFGGDAVLFGAAYLIVRLLHLVLSTIGEPGLVQNWSDDTRRAAGAARLDPAGTVATGDSRGARRRVVCLERSAGAATVVSSAAADAGEAHTAGGAARREVARRSALG